MFGFLKRKKPRVVPFDQQAQTLAECGFSFATPFGPESLLGSFDRGAYEESPYWLMLAVMGGECETSEEGRFLSDQIWHFDAECIEDHGDYAKIARRMSVLAGDDLPLEDIADFVDVEKGEAWLSFNLDGAPHQWDARVDDDWVDPKVFSKFAALLGQRDGSRRYCYLNGPPQTQGQDCLIACLTEAQARKVVESTGLEVEWMS